MKSEKAKPSGVIPSELLLELYEAGDLDAFASKVLGLLARLVRSEVTSYNEVNPARGRVVWKVEPLDAEFPEAKKVFEAHMAEHPLIAHYYSTGDPRTLKLSDFVSLRELRSLGIYQDCYHLIGVDRQLAVTVPGPRSLVVGITVNRKGRDFSEADRMMLTQLRPHLIQAYSNAARFAAQSSKLRVASAALEVLDEGVAVVDRRGRLAYSNPAARALLLRVTGISTSSRALPRKLVQLVEELAGRPQPTLSGPGGELGVRVLPGRGDKETVVVLREPPASSDVLVARAEQVGLTPRESQILVLVADGRTNLQVAAQLGISPTTVRTHLENAFPKLGVTNRTAAAAMLRASAPTNVVLNPSLRPARASHSQDGEESVHS